MDVNSRSLFFAASKPPSTTFDDYGAWQGSFPGLNLSLVLTTTSGGGTTDGNGVGSGILERPGFGYDSAMIVTSANGSSFGTNQIEFTPASGQDWGTVASASDISRTTRALAPSAGESIETAGVAFNIDADGTHAVGRSVIRTRSNANGIVADHACISITDDKASFDTGTINFQNTDNQRFGTASSSVDRFWAAFSKDQAGLNSGSGQPTMLLTQFIDTDTTPRTTSVAKALFFYDNGYTNTHGNRMRGQFLGGRLNGTTREAWFLVCYNQWSSGNDGQQIVRIDCTAAGARSQGFTTNVDTTVSIDVNGGFNQPGNSIYPHGLCNLIDTADNVATGATRYLYYVDLSSVGSGTTPIRINSSNQQWRAISQVGVVLNDPVYAYIDSNTLTIARFARSNNTMQTAYATLSITNGNYCTGIWPIPDTNRLVLAFQGYLRVVELS